MKLDKLLNTLIIEPKIKINSKLITASDEQYFFPLQFLILSLFQSHESDLFVVDLGLTSEQLAWLQDFPLTILPKPELIYPEGQLHWQQWNKPVYIQQLSGKVLWLDADCLVRGSLKWLDIASDYRMFCSVCFAAEKFVGDNPAKIRGCLANRDQLYAKYPVDERLEELPNNGVIAIDLDRKQDQEFLDSWTFMCQEAGKHSEIRPMIRFWDQGAFQWALEKTGNLHCLSGDMRLNDPQSIFGRHTFDEFCLKVEEAKAKILHFAGNQKPFVGFGFDRLPKVDLSTRQDLRIFILDHNRLETDPTKQHLIQDAPHFQRVNLDDLSDNNALAESRIYQSDLIDKCECDYIGLCSASWNYKYSHLCRKVEDLHKLKMEPNIVWAGCLAKKDWPDETDAQHPGMLKLVQEIAEAHEAQHLYRPSVWNNNFICHREVMLDFLTFWRETYEYVRSKYKDDLPFDNRKYDENDMKRFGKTRAIAYLCERFALLYFANRTDLIVKQVPF